MTDPSQDPERQDGAPSQSGTSQAAYALGQDAARNKWLLLAIGAVSLIGGALAIAMPFVASITAVFLAAWALIASGIVGLFAAFRRNHGWHMLAAALSSALAIIIGALILVQPVLGLFTITAVTIGFFAASGVLRLYYGVKMLGREGGGGWMIAGGILALILAVMLFVGLPLSAAWVPGLLLGVDLVMWGAILITAGTQNARLAAARETAAL